MQLKQLATDYSQQKHTLVKQDVLRGGWPRVISHVTFQCYLPKRYHRLYIGLAVRLYVFIHPNPSYYNLFGWMNNPV